MSLKRHAEEILEIIERGSYTAGDSAVSIKEQIQLSVEGSRLYSPDQLSVMRTRLPSGTAPVIEVIDGTTQEVAQSMSQSEPVVLLNFASARNPGGGFLNGAKAQEEDLCRCSTLYATLVRHRSYYDTNRNQSSLLYTDYVIYSPDVPFFKIRGTGDFLVEPFLASVITAPAPNTRPYLAGSGEPELLKQCFERRWKNVLAIASDVGVPNVLLGAWGCGAFGGDPVMAAETAKVALLEFGSAFERVVFAIPGIGKQSRRNLEEFESTLAGSVDGN